MEALAYDLELELGMTSDWPPLFGGQLLTAAPCSADNDDGCVLQDWTDELGGQLVTNSRLNLLQDSLWPDDINGLASTISSGFLRKESHFRLNEDLSPISPETVIFSSDYLSDNAADDLSLVSDHGDQLGCASINESCFLSSSPIDVQFEQGDIFLSPQFIAVSTSPQSFNSRDEVNIVKFAPAVSPLPQKRQSSQNTSGDLFSFQDQCSFDGVPQEIKYRFASELDNIEFDSDTLRDAESVCEILKQLNDGSIVPTVDLFTHKSSILSPVSPEEVESVLSHNFCSGPDVLQSLSDTPLAQDSASLKVEDPYTSITSEYLQSPVSLKAEYSPRGFSKLPSDPYSAERKPDRHLKKKEQNKTAALKYRQKKREEKGVVLTEVEILEMKNAELKARADDLTREISYLRGLLDEIQKQ